VALLEILWGSRKERKGSKLMIHNLSANVDNSCFEVGFKPGRGQISEKR
jgi:hypothetical protein